MTTISPTYLEVRWTVSRGRETYGYNICTVRDLETGKAYRCNGGGYDLLGTSFGEWMADRYQLELQHIRDRAHMVWASESREGPWTHTTNKQGLYGMSAQPDGTVRLDGACGLSSMERVAEAIGIKLTRTWDRKGHTTGYVVAAA